MKTRIAHFADTHLGYRQYSLAEREQDFYDRFNEIIDDMIEKDVDAVVHSGDLFENPKPPINALLAAQRGFNKLLNKKIPIYVISGNHDQMQRSNTAIPQKLFENENFHILDVHHKWEIFDEIFIGGLNYITPSFQEIIKEQLLEIKEESEKYKYKILVLHGGMSKYDEYTNELEMGSVPEGFDYYAMGHIHQRKNGSFKGGILTYPGSPEIRTKKEANDFESKGYNIVTFDDEKEEPVSVEEIHIPLKRQFITDTTNIDKLDDKLYEIKEKIENDDKKAIVDLTINKGNFERSEIMDRIYNILGEYALYIKFQYNPSEKVGEEPVEVGLLTAESIINESDYEEDQKEYIIDLYHTLSQSNMEEATKITDNYYKKRLCDKDDN